MIIPGLGLLKDSADLVEIPAIMVQMKIILTQYTGSSSNKPN